MNYVPKNEISRLFLYSKQNYLFHLLVIQYLQILGHFQKYSSYTHLVIMDAGAVLNNTNNHNDSKAKTREPTNVGRLNTTKIRDQVVNRTREGTGPSSSQRDCQGKRN